jgi:vitamin B12 transporter
MDPGRVSPAFGNFDFPFSDFANLNRAGFDYQGDYVARSWARTTVGYHFEDENGWVGDLTSLPLGHGLRRNHAVFGQEVLTWTRVTVIAGARFEHNESFGNRRLPRIAASVLALKGGKIFSGTRLRFAYGTGIKEPRLEESFGVGGFGIIPNPNLKAEENRSLEAGVQQSFVGGKYWLGATYFNNLFTNQIAFNFDPVLFVSQYLNINRALAHGSEVEYRARPWSRLSVDASYTYTSTQILSAPLAFDPLVSAGAPLLRMVRSMQLSTCPGKSGLTLVAKAAGGLQVDLYVAPGPFVLEENIPAPPGPMPAGGSMPGMPAVKDPPGTQ